MCFFKQENGKCKVTIYQVDSKLIFSFVEEEISKTGNLTATNEYSLSVGYKAPFIMLLQLENHIVYINYENSPLVHPPSNDSQQDCIWSICTTYIKGYEPVDGLNINKGVH